MKTIDEQVKETDKKITEQERKPAIQKTAKSKHILFSIQKNKSKGEEIRRKRQEKNTKFKLKFKKRTIHKTSHSND